MVGARKMAEADFGERLVHQEAVGWVKMGLCRGLFDGLMACEAAHGQSYATTQRDQPGQQGDPAVSHGKIEEAHKRLRRLVAGANTSHPGCSDAHAALQRCIGKKKTESAAWSELNHRGAALCAEYQPFAQCMSSGEDKRSCQPLWNKLQMAAARTVLKDVEHQKTRMAAGDMSSGNMFSPPQLYTPPRS